jgi:beta-D-galactosyl-(1->4)-L-rhamnose phosphorylase
MTNSESDDKMEKYRVRGDFTLPGEAGYEDLTLSLAEKWGADVIRDSDGTTLSDQILSSGYGIYSTVCMVREVNDWAKRNPDKIQQNFLMSIPVTAQSDTVLIHPLDGYFKEQFRMNLSDSPKKYWQVFDRTTGEEKPSEQWEYNGKTGDVTVRNCIKYHRYTVNFLTYRIWEEISMYNSITNHLDTEHVMAVEPRCPETQEILLQWLDQWCRQHPATTVVRFTSMFYNFAWFWGNDERNRNLLSDWGSYDFTANPLALEGFEQEYGYRMTSEDFVNKGKYNITHLNPSRRYRDWIDFTNRFVTQFGAKCIDIVHRYGKKAYVFYDDSWIGVEPYSARFANFKFDGIIKCVFNAFEVRMCADVPYVGTKEIRLHPYLFPTGLTGEPTFMEGGDPTLDAKRFWKSVRRGLLRVPVDRIGLGGYLHLAHQFPDFCDYIEKLSDEFRMLKSLHIQGKPYTLKPRVAILTSWGVLRSWICSGHLHEHPDLDLTNILESLAGLPLDVQFLSFDEVRQHGISKDISVLINAGTIDSAWSGGDNWNDPSVVEAVSEFVAGGGGLISVNEATAKRGGDTRLALSNILGVDLDTGDRICSGKYQFTVAKSHFIMECDAKLEKKSGVFAIDGKTQVLKADGALPVLTTTTFGKGRSVYMASFRYGLENTRILLNSVLWACGMEPEKRYCVPDNFHTECAYFTKSNRLVVINNSEELQKTSITLLNGETKTVCLEPLGINVLECNGGNNL